MRQYSDSIPGRIAPGTLTLALDSGSPTSSIALGAAGRLVAAKSLPSGPGSPPLLSEIERLLNGVGAQPAGIRRVIASRGPGSFTGLRIGLATALGLHEALGVPAVAVPAFRALASQATGAGTVVAAVDALRGEWFVQAFATSSGPSLGEPRLITLDTLASWDPCQVVAADLDALRARLPATFESVQAGPLAPRLLALADDPDLEWRSETLVRPLYLRPPAAATRSQRGL